MFRFQVALAVVSVIACCNGWDYDEASPDGPLHWSLEFPFCGYTHQSPINIDTSAVNRTKDLGDFVFTSYDKKPSTQYTLVNVGHSVQINLNLLPEPLQIRKGGLAGIYTLEQLHFHWGASATSGTEHTIDGKQHGLEIHLVHYNSDKYSNVAAAIADGVEDSEGVAVLAVMVDVTTHTSDISNDLGHLVDDLGKVAEINQTTLTDSFAINGLMPKATRSYYRYHGSLTTPRCQESVVWTVFTDPIYITKDQLDKFHTTMQSETGGILEKNCRPTQPLNGRVVYLNSAGTTAALLPVGFYLLLACTTMLKFFN